MFYFYIPLALANSPSGCAIRCIAVGETPKGMDILFPRIVVLISLLLTFLKTRGRILILEKL